MLVEAFVGRHDQRPDLPIVAFGFLAFLPHQRIAFAGQDDDMRAGAMRVRLLVGADGKLRDVARHRTLGHIEADVSAPCAAFLRRNQRQVDDVGHEIGRKQITLGLRLGAEIVRLARKTVLEVVSGVEDEIDIVIKIEDRGRIGDRDVTRRLLARTVEMLVPGIERNGEHRARLPLESDACAGIVPHRGGAAPVQYQDHFFVELALGGEFFARRDFADIAIVRRARGIVIDIDALAAPARPGLQIDGAQIGNVMAADDLKAFTAHPALIRRVPLFLGREFSRQLFGNHRLVRHGHSPLA